jgi:hypothetical protein
MHPAASRPTSHRTHPLSDSRLTSRSAEPSRALSRSFSRAMRHQRPSHSRSFGPTNRASRAHPARNPADASARGFTANHRLSSRSTSGFGLGPGEYATKLPGGSKSLAQLVDLLGEFQAPGALRFIRCCHEPKRTPAYADLPSGSASPACRNPLERQTRAPTGNRAHTGTRWSDDPLRRPSIQRRSWAFSQPGPQHRRSQVGSTSRSVVAVPAGDAISSVIRRLPACRSSPWKLRVQPPRRAGLDFGNRRRPTGRSLASSARTSWSAAARTCGRWAVSARERM